MRIALHCDRLSGWQGGRDFLYAIWEGLKLACPSDHQPALICGRKRDGLAWRLARISKYLLMQHSLRWSWIAQEFERKPYRKVLQATFGPKAKFLSVDVNGVEATRHRMGPLFDVIGPIDAPPSPAMGKAWLGYIPDCQHRHMPHFFSEQDRRWRDDSFLELLKTAPVVIVGSANAKADLENFYGRQYAEVVALPFSAAPNPEWLDIDPAKAIAKYHLPEYFFICSNQFWLHKNHRIVLEVIARAQAEERPITVVFTGEMHDYRDPTYVPALLKQVGTYGIQQYCHFLGLIPKIEQIAIMRAAIALIQPTLFEGSPGGGAVHEAISIGQRVIVSDIQINREISRWVDAYFPPNNPAKLLKEMRLAQGAPKRQISKTALISQGIERRQLFGAALRSAYALASKRCDGFDNQAVALGSEADFAHEVPRAA